MKALVADDDETVCSGLEQLIPWKELGIELVGSAPNGDTAYKMAAECRPDVIICDICMPVLDGLALSKKVKETFGDTSIIIMSAFENFEYARKALRYGVKDYIVKPINPQKMEELIERLKKIKYEENAKNSAIKDFFGGGLKKELLNLLRKSDKEEIVGFIKKKIGEYAAVYDDMKGVCLQLIDVLYLYLEEIGVSANASSYSKTDTINKITALKSNKEIFDFTVALYENIFNYSDKCRQSHSAVMAVRAKKIVDEEYMNEAMSLQYLADKLGFSTQHISSMFSQICGMNFSDYLSKVRMEKACELLRNFTLKINDISTKVGYTDPHYFAKVFKRVMHKTPSEFRSIVENADF